MYKLPNGKKISEEALLEALKDYTSDYNYCLDSETGEIIKSEEAKDGSDQSRYYPVKKLSDRVIVSWMHDFAEQIVADEDPMLAGKLICVLKQDKPVENFLAELEKTDWIYGWPQWEFDSCCGEMENWLDELPFMIEDDWQEFYEENCDCPICKAMAEGRSDEKSLKDAFREANFKQAMENIFDENKND